MVFDWGGGTEDVSILTIQSQGAYKVEATWGNTTLGGEDIDARIQGYAMDKILQRYGIDLRKPERFGFPTTVFSHLLIVHRAQLRSWLRLEAERAKRALSKIQFYSIDLPFYGRTLSVGINRQQVPFSSSVQHLF